MNFSLQFEKRTKVALSSWYSFVVNYKEANVISGERSVGFTYR